MSEEEEIHQEFTNEYVYCVLLPTCLSITVSTIIFLNFCVVSTHLRAFIYHQISTVFALCDIISSTGTLLGAPNLLDTSRCTLRENLFLCGSFMKVVAVTFNTCLIYYVLSTSIVPSVKSVGMVASVWLLLSALCMFFITHFNAARVLCFDPVAGSFSPSDVKQSELRAFSWAYFIPITVFFLVIITLLIMTYVRLHKVFNSALLHLVQRLLPYPLIFCLAYLPACLFQVIHFTTNGKRILFLKRLGLVGINMSGAAFGAFYLYVHISDIGAESRPLLNNGQGNSHSSDGKNLSWTNSRKMSSSTCHSKSGSMMSETELTQRESDRRDRPMSFFSERSPSEDGSNVRRSKPQKSFARRVSDFMLSLQSDV